MSRVAITIPEGFLDAQGVSHVFWLCKVGDTVPAGKAVAGVEASKGTKFMNAPTEGTLEEISIPTGGAVEDGMTIGYLQA